MILKVYDSSIIAENGCVCNRRRISFEILQDLAGKLDGTDVIINLTDPGWCRTDLGGPNAPNSPESAIPGIVVGAFVDDKLSGRYLNAPFFTGMTLEDAVKKAEAEFKAPY